MYIGYKLPRSYQIMDILQNISVERLEKTLFNDIIRETISQNAVFVIKEKRIFIISYFILTTINTIIDLIDFLIVLVDMSKCASSAKVVFISYFIISIVYLVIDFAYFFWGGQLRYIFPPEYLRSISDLMHGVIDRIVIILKLDKKKTNVISEAKAQKSNGPCMNNGGVNLLEYIMKDSLGVYNTGENNKYLPKFDNGVINKDNLRYDINGNNNYPNSNEILN